MARDFDGINDQFEYASSGLDATSGFTMACWHNSDSLLIASDVMLLINCEVSGGIGHDLRIQDIG